VIKMKQENPEKCFACGPKNERGLQLSFTPDQKGVQAETVLEDIYQGYPGIAHGGIVTTLLDEAMAHVLMQKGYYAVTARLEVRFRRPVPLREKICIRGLMEEERSSQRIKILTARVMDDEGRILASGEGTFVDQTKKIAGGQKEAES